MASEAGAGFAQAIERISSAVVVLHVCNVRAFDGEGRGSSSATGFVVDRERGIILTNRHVVSAGPVQADATFLSKEEVPVVPLYRDPVHDFGFFRFDPAKINFLPNLTEIPLSPERAKVGLEIRVVGNDAGEKLSILAGTLARLDRDAPNYGSKEYNDHNTFYIAAASGTSGGSSGSPVIDKDGHCVALNAGGKTRAASSFYLPLDRVVRALKYVRNGEAVPRRTLQCIFKHLAFAECVRLGLDKKEEAAVRNEYSDATGLLVAHQVVPSGPAHRAGLQPGDIVLKLNGERVHHFLPLESTLDDSKSVDLHVKRGDKTLDFTVETDDLHAISPSEFIEISGAIIHPLSYQQAINNHLAPGGVYVSSSGFMLGRADINWDTLILAVNDDVTPDLDAFEKAICKYPNLSNVSIRFIELSNKFREQVRTVTIDRTWFFWRRAKRCDETGLWHHHDLPAPEGDFEMQPQHISYAHDTIPAVVLVSFDVPFQCDGIPISSFHGAGIVLDAKAGLVLCDRNTVPTSLGNVTLTFAGSVEIPAVVEFLHPLHNFSFVRYNPALLDVEQAEGLEHLAFDLVESSEPLKSGDETTFVGLSHNMTQIRQRCTVTNIERLLFPHAKPPRFTAKNQEVIHIDKHVRNIGGAFLDVQGRVQAFWFSFSYQNESSKDKETFAGIPASIVFDTLRELGDAGPSNVHSVCTLATDFVVTPIAKARAGMGLSTEWVKKLASVAKTSSNNHVLTIRNVLAGSPPAELLKPGDLLLAIDSQPINDFRSAEKAVAMREKVKVTVLRDLNELELEVPTCHMSCTGTTRLVLFAGLFLQAPHSAVAFRGFLPVDNAHEGVYCSRWFYGSPAHRYGLCATHCIVAINDEPTPDLDAVVSVVSKLEDGQFVRIKTVSLCDKNAVFTLKCDYHYWPTVDLVRDVNSGKWHLNHVEQLSK